MSLAIESITIAALLLAWCALSSVSPPEGATLAVAILGVVTVMAWLKMAARRTDARVRRSMTGGWWGRDAAIRHTATSVAIGGCLALVLWASLRAAAGAKLDGAGSLLVLLVVGASASKFVAETYLYAQIGGEPSPRQASAQQLIGPLSGWSKLRYTLGAFGGIILPLGAQILAGGSKNIPAVVDAAPPAVLAAMALACLIPAELIERRLFDRAVA